MPGPTSPRSTPTAPPPTPRPSSQRAGGGPGLGGHGLGRRPRDPPRAGRPGGAGSMPSARPASRTDVRRPSSGRLVDGERTRHPGLPAALRLGIVSRAAGHARAGNAGAAPHPRRPLDETVVRSVDRRRGCHRLPGTPSLTAGDLLTPEERPDPARAGTGRIRGPAARLAIAPHLSDRRLGAAPLAPRVQRPRPVRPTRAPSDRRSDAGLQGDPGDLRDGLDSSLRGRRDRLLPRQRAPSLRLPEQAGRGLDRAGCGPARFL